MLKGFATMPVILAVVMLIFGVAYVHLTDLDRSVADGIGKELSLSDFLKYELIDVRGLTKGKGNQGCQ